MVMVGISKHATDEHQQQTGEVVGFRDTETGPIPADWKLVSVGSLFSFKNGLNKAKQFLAMVRQLSITWMYSQYLA